jgi:hypothetical protein
MSILIKGFGDRIQNIAMTSIGGLEMRIRTKLTGIICGILLLSLGILGGIYYWQAYNLITKAVEEELTITTAGAADGVSRWLEARRAETETLANSPLVLGDRSGAIAYLAAEANYNKLYTRFFLVDDKGNTIYGSSWPAGCRSDGKSDDQYRQRRSYCAAGDRSPGIQFFSNRRNC